MTDEGPIRKVDALAALDLQRRRCGRRGLGHTRGGNCEGRKQTGRNREEPHFQGAPMQWAEAAQFPRRARPAISIAITTKYGRLPSRVKIFIVIVMKQRATPPRQRGRPRSFDREQALERAMHLFWSRGYEGTSISDLTEAMGVTPPSLYGAYGDKKRLFFEAVEHYEQTAGCFAREALTGEPTAESAIRRLLLGAVKSFSAPETPKGCLVVLGATNCAAESAEVGQALAERRRQAEAAVHARLLAGREAGEFSEHADVDALSALVTATLFGLAIKARDGASNACLSGVVEQLMAMWPRRDAETEGPERTKSRRRTTAARSSKTS